MTLWGSFSISRLKVYDSLAPDGQRGGTPHVHLLCTELYFVLSGSGAVDLLDANGCSRVELHPGDALTFTPGTIHRLLNPNRDLEILVVMEHNGLPEQGDNVVCFEETWLAKAALFAQAMQVASLDAAYLRRDRGVAGLLAFQAAFAVNLATGQAALRHFFDLAVARTAPFRPAWAQLIEQESRAASNQLAALNNGDLAALLQAQHQWIAAAAPTSLGFCGYLQRFQPEGLLA